MALVLQRKRVANPARRRANSGARRRRLTPAQIAAGFGGKRRQAAQKHGRRRRSTPTVKNKARTAPRRRRPVRQNIGEIITIGLGNPARKRKNKMAQRSSKKTARRRSSAPKIRRRAKKTNPFMVRHHRRRARKNPATPYRRRRHNRRRHNPGGGLTRGVTGMVSKAAWTVAGLIGARGLTQVAFSAMRNPSANTGVLGYISNIIASFVLGGAVAKFKSREAGQLVTIGGLAGVVARAVAEYSPIGGFVKAQLSGLGDYGLGIYLPTQFGVPGVPADPQTLAGGAQMLNPWPQPQLTAGKGVGRLGDVGSGVGSRYGGSGRYN